MIEDYLKAHPGPSFASEIADALGLDFDITFKTINKLLEEGRIKKAKGNLNEAKAYVDLAVEK